MVTVLCSLQCFDTDGWVTRGTHSINDRKFCCGAGEGKVKDLEGETVDPGSGVGREGDRGVKTPPQLRSSAVFT